jgi:hypothetical protein
MLVDELAKLAVIIFSDFQPVAVDPMSIYCLGLEKGQAVRNLDPL